MPYIKNKIRVNVPKRSGFDKRHRNSGTSFCGTLTPLLCDELIPGSRVSLRLPINVQLPPLVSDTFMNVKYKVEAFFVPSRLLCASFEDFFCDFPRRIVTASDPTVSQSAASFTDVTAAIPVILLDSTLDSSYYGAGSLLDYLGYKVDAISAAHDSQNINPLPLIAYHLIWQEWYRNPRVQNPAFAPNLGLFSYRTGYQGTNKFIASLPYFYFHRDFVGDDSITSGDNTVITASSATIASMVCADGTNIFNLRQRNFDLDYFTGARPTAQQGDASAVSFTTDVTGTADLTSGDVTAAGSGSVTIAALRAANSLQQFRERNNIPSPRLVDQVKARYGANLSDGVAQRPICIGSASYDVTSRGIDQSAPESSSTGANPFSSVAAQYGRAFANGNDFIIKDFTANEPGYIMVLGSLVPEVTYASGISPMFFRYREEGSITDMACPLLQNVGDQPILDSELQNNLTLTPAAVFGYQDRFADWMYIPNQCHGEFRNTGSLSSFVLQRVLSSATLGSSFLEIPTSYLDDVFAVTSETANLSYWYDAMIDYKVSMPLAEFSIPSLQDPAYEHGESVVLHRNGQIF